MDQNNNNNINNNNNTNLKIISKPMKKLINDSSIYNCDNNKLQTILRDLKKREYQNKNRKHFLLPKNNLKNQNPQIPQIPQNSQYPQQQQQQQQEKYSINYNNNNNNNNNNNFNKIYDYIVPISNNGSTIYYKNNTSTHYYNKNNDYLKNIYSNENYNILCNNKNNNSNNNNNNNNNNSIKVSKTINGTNYNRSLVFLKSLPIVPYPKSKIISKNEDSVVPSLYNESSIIVTKNSYSNGPLPSFHQIQSSSSSLELPPIVDKE